MLAHIFNQYSWLKEEDSSIFNLTRWQQQTNLLHSLFEAQAVFVIQVQDTDCQIVCERETTQCNHHHSSTISYSQFLQQLDHDFPNHDENSQAVISHSIYWPDGNLFGYLILCHPLHNNEANARVCHSIVNLYQAELKNLILAKQVEALSMQDSQTCMLNPYGFSMMAPRQLSLSRRFGSHAGLVVVELNSSKDINLIEKDNQIRQLARIITDTIRAADVAARLDDNRFIILAFLDHESNLASLVARLYKQIDRVGKQLKVEMGKSFFTPDSHFELEPMLKVAEADLIGNKEDKITTQPN